MLYTQLLKQRIDGLEKGVPVRLMHKSNLKSFCNEIGVPLPEELAKFESVDDIRLSDLPADFVLKPAYASTAEGVMVLSRTDDGYYDSMTSRTWKSSEIIELQRKVYEKYAGVRNRVTIVEQRVKCTEHLDIPADYKFLAFQGVVGLIIRIDRNSDLLRMSYFDGDFVPIVDDRIKFNNDIAHRESRLPPANWRSLLDLARRVSVAVPSPCARIDLFSDLSGPLLGEITLTPGSFYYSAGHTVNRAENERLGQLWDAAASRLAFVK